MSVTSVIRATLCESTSQDPYAEMYPGNPKCPDCGQTMPSLRTQPGYAGVQCANLQCPGARPQINLPRAEFDKRFGT